MDVIFVIRGIIFLVAGLIVILFKKQVYRFQIWVFRKLHTNYEKDIDKIPYNHFGLIFIIISGILFAYSLSV